MHLGHARVSLRDTTAQLNEIPLHRVALWMGMSLPKFGTTLCPFPDHRERKPSFEIKRSGLRWICYSCNRRGGAIDFVMYTRDTDFMSARKWLLERYGDPLPASVAEIPGLQLEQAPVHQNEAHEDPEVYETLLSMCSILPDGLAYLNDRGISRATIDQFRVGQLPGNRTPAEALVTIFGFDRAFSSGLLTKFSTERNPKLALPDGGLLFPFIENGRVVSLQARVLGQASNQKWFNLRGRRRRTFNVGVLESDTRQIAICEGIPDTLSAHELGFAAIGLLGVSAELQRDEIQRLRNRTVVILLDWDPPGEQRATEMKAQLSKHGIVSIRKQRPHPKVKDLNDFLATIRGANGV